MVLALPFATKVILCQGGTLYGRAFVMSWSPGILMGARYAIMLINHLHLPVHLRCLQFKLTCAYHANRCTLCRRLCLGLLTCCHSTLHRGSLAFGPSAVVASQTTCTGWRAAAACNVQPAVAHSLFLCLPPSSGCCSRCADVCGMCDT